MEFSTLASELLNRSETLCREWFPDGRKRGHEYRVGDLSGAPGESLSINLNTGRWADFATGDAGGDLISLYAAKHGIEQGEAFRRLTNGHAPACMARPVPVKQKPEPDVLMPVPASAGEPLMRHAGFGMPTASWRYRNASGELLGVVARYDTGDRKQIVPWVYTPDGWVAKAFPTPRPLYGLDRLAALPKGQVLLVEGEKAADAAHAFIGSSMAVVTWPGGAKAVSRVDFTPLRGRSVVLWPDADTPGVAAMCEIANALRGVASVVKFIDVSDMPEAWDAADSGFTADGFQWWARPRVSVMHEQSAVVEAIPAPVDDQIPVPTLIDWETLGLACTEGKNPKPHSNLDNVVRVIENHPDLKRRIWYDEFLDAIVTDWQGPVRQWKDADDIKLQLYMQRYIGLTKVNVGTCHDAAVAAAFHDVRNECRAWIEAQRWDGVERIERLIPDGFGAEDTTYTRAVGRCWMISMVARVFSPGCKVDTVPVLEGDQGKGKSSALAALGGKWFTECHESVTTKDFYGVLQGHMLVEISEMHSFTRAEVERIKGIISCQSDRFRKAYGRNTEDHPRQTVLACTTNRYDWQRDDTGARRFWPVRCGTLDLEWIREHRAQLFAEALSAFQNGAVWWDIPADEQAEQVSQRREIDVWEHVVLDWMEINAPARVDEVLLQALRIEVPKQDNLAARRVRAILTQAGYVTKSVRIGSQVTRAWSK